MKMEEVCIGNKIKGIESSEVFTVAEINKDSIVAEQEPRQEGEFVIQDKIEIPISIIDKFEIVK